MTQEPSGSTSETPSHSTTTGWSWQLELASSSCQDQPVVVEWLGVSEVDPLGSWVNCSDLVQQHLRVFLLAKNAPDWTCDVRRRERCRCYLIEERLEEVMVPTIDKDHRNGRISEPSSGR